MMARVEGAYTLSILTKNAIYGVRDPWGLRPLAVGKLPDGYAIASESCAFGTIGAELVREAATGRNRAHRRFRPFLHAGCASAESGVLHL